MSDDIQDVKTEPCDMSHDTQDVKTEPCDMSHDIQDVKTQVIHWKLYKNNFNVKKGGRDSSVGKSSTSQAGDQGSNPDEGLNWVTQCMNERGRNYQL